MKVTFKPAAWEGGYDVLVDGEKKGTVNKRSQSYNLRRQITVRFWTVQGDTEHVHHRTRADAVEALLSTL